MGTDGRATELGRWTARLGDKHAFLPAIARFYARLDAQWAPLSLEPTCFGGLQVELMVIDQREGKALEAARMCAETLAGGRAAFFRVRPHAEQETDWETDRTTWRAWVRFEVRPTAGKWFDTPPAREEPVVYGMGGLRDIEPLDAELADLERRDRERAALRRVLARPHCHVHAIHKPSCEECIQAHAGAVLAGTWREEDGIAFTSMRHPHPDGCGCSLCDPEAWEEIDAGDA